MRAIQFGTCYLFNYNHPAQSRRDAEVLAEKLKEEDVPSAIVAVGERKQYQLPRSAGRALRKANPEDVMVLTGREFDLEREPNREEKQGESAAYIEFLSLPGSELSKKEVLGRIFNRDIKIYPRPRLAISLLG